MTGPRIEVFDQESEWELLSDFVAADHPGGDRALVERVVEALKGLGIQPAQARKITEELAQALGRPRRTSRGVELLPVAKIRIWTSRDSAGHGGWGFFIVEKQSSERQLAAEDPANILEMFLFRIRHP